jgi:hypothetical protein
MASGTISIIQPEVASVVMPFFLCEAFSQSREYLTKINDYADATSQRDILGNIPGNTIATSRRKWNLKPKSKAIEKNPDGFFYGRDIVALRQFYLQQFGPTVPFIFYDFSESIPYGNYDPFGDDPNGKFVVRFDGAWQQVQNAGQVGVANITLVELVDTSGGNQGYDYSNPKGFILGL